MCKSALHPFLAALPKVEHHMHLEGALTPSLFFSLCAQNKIPLPAAPEYASEAALEARYAAFSSLDDFLAYYYQAMSCLRTAADFEALAHAYLARAAAQGVRHAELFFDPQAHTSRGVPYAEVVAGFTRAQAAALARHGVSVLLVPCFLRHLPVAHALDAYALLEPDLAAGRLTGIGLDSSEKDFPPELFGPVFRRAADGGIRRTAHAGEECGPESVVGALEHLQVQRIDHGRAIEHDERLMRQIADTRTLVTLCPLSNVCLQGVSTVAEMPIRRFLDAGVAFSINSDDPAYFGGYILENYCAVQDAFGLTKAEWVGIVGASIEGSWCEEERKAELRAMLDRVGKD